MVNNVVATWDITSKCNLKCKHCYNANKYNSGRIDIKPDMDLVQAKHAIDILHDNKINVLNILGGEPFMYPHIFEIIQYINTKNINIVITTNGTLLTEEMINKIINVDIAQLDISLDGACIKTHDFMRGNGTFERATKNIKRLINAVKERNVKMNIGISYTIGGNLEVDKDLLLPLCLELGVSSLFVQFIAYTGNALINKDKLSYNLNRTLDNFEYLLDEKRNKEYDDIYIRIDTLPLLKYYIKQKYNYPMEITQESMECKGGDKLLYLRNDIAIHPCGVIDRDVNLDIMSKYIKREQIYLNDGMDIFDLDYFKTFREFKNSEAPYKYSTTCKKCMFKDTCQPCPIFYMREEEYIIPLCEIIMDKLSKLHKNILKHIPIKLETTSIVTKGNIKYIRNESEKEEDVELTEDTSILILDLIDGKTSIEEIINCVNNKYDAIPYEEVKSDVIEFISDLIFFNFVK